MSKTAKEVIRCLNILILEFKPKIIKCDNGGEFTAGIFIDWAEFLDIFISHGRIYTPRDQGTVEIFNRWFKLRIL
jgi:putative transposase